MKKIILAFLVLNVVGLCAGTLATAKVLELKPHKSRLDYSFRSTLHPVHGQANKFEGRLELDDEEPLKLISGKVVVDPAQMDSQNKKRDRNMYKMFEIQVHPEIIYEIDELSEVELMEDGSYHGVLSGRLIIKNVSRDTDMEVVLLPEEGGYLMRGQGNVSLENFGLEPPSVLGVIRVFDDVAIDFEAFFQ